MSQIKHTGCSPEQLLFCRSTDYGALTSVTTLVWAAKNRKYRLFTNITGFCKINRIIRLSVHLFRYFFWGSNFCSMSSISIDSQIVILLGFFRLPHARLGQLIFRVIFHSKILWNFLPHLGATQLGQIFDLPHFQKIGWGKSVYECSNVNDINQIILLHRNQAILSHNCTHS